MKRNILILILALSLIMGFSLVTLTAPVTLRWNLDSEPPTLDPALAHDTTSLLVIGEIFLGLTNYDSEIGEIIPELAESWSVSLSTQCSGCLLLRPLLLRLTCYG
ncbi:hypothetical protein ES705_30873 [subsurface metagenome]